MKKSITLLVFALIIVASTLAQTTYPSSNINLLSNINPETGLNSYGDKYSGCWGWYQANKNREYAILGSQSGVYFVDVTNPSAPVICDFVPGKRTGCTWRELKTYQNYCYAVSDDSSPNSFQIMDMSYLPDSVRVVYDSKALFERAHTIWVDGNKLYAGGITKGNGGGTFPMAVYSLTNPASPTLIRSLNQDIPSINYVHDMYVRNDTIFASTGYQGLRVLKFNANNTFSSMGSLTNYAGSAYNHSSFLTSNAQTLVFTDEVPASLPIRFCNVTNLSNIQVLATRQQFNGQTTPHNPYVLGNNWAVIASYQDGLQIYSISTPSNPTLAGYFDTYPQGGGNINNYGNDAYSGLWGAYPYLPSKNIIALDMSNGLFMLRFPPLATSINENTVEKSQYLLYPNPAQTKVTFNVPSQQKENMKVSVMSVDGKIIYEKNVQGSYYSHETYESIDVSGIPSGMYFVNLSTSTQTFFTQKLTVNH
jgi:choice-of-anchor B domain-containing protein